jgi:MFS family permease
MKALESIRGISVHMFDAFHHRNYRFVWTSAISVGGGYWLQQVVVGWLVYDITRSAFLTSVALGLEAIPLIITGPIGGFLVDVFDRRKLFVAIYLYQGSLTLTLALGVIFWEIGPLEIFVFVLLVGFSWVISEPARSAIIANTVPKEGLLNAFALTTLGFGGTRCQGRRKIVPVGRSKSVPPMVNAAV